MPFKLGPPELIIILIILLLLFGASRLPQLGGALGKGIREFRKGVTSVDEGERKRGKARGKAKKV